MTSPSAAPRSELTPREIVRELDQYIIGQDAAKRSVAIALRNRWRRLQVAPGLREEIMPNNIILIGPTGVGKTEIARRLARLANAPFIKVEASKFTEVGYVGRDVESIIRDLTEFAVTMVKTEHRKGVEEQGPGTGGRAGAGYPPPRPRASVPRRTAEAEPVQPGRGRQRNAREVPANGSAPVSWTTAWWNSTFRRATVPLMQVVGPMNMEEMGVNIQDLFGSMFPKKMKRRKVSVAEARTLLTNEEAAKLIDQDAAIREAIQRVENSGIVFLDEIDKIAGTKGHRAAPTSRAKASSATSSRSSKDPT